MRRGRVLAAIAIMGVVADATLGQDDVEAAVAEEGVDVTAPEELQGPDDFWHGWTTSAELGMNGSTGNTERFNFRAGLRTERLTDLMETRGEATYTLGIDEGDTSENKALLLGRNDWLVPNSRWRYYARASLEYDELQSYDILAQADGGVGYEFIDDETFLLLGRAGAGVSQKFGGDVDDRFRVEAVLGGDFEWKIDEAQKLFVTVDYYPAINLWPKYRITSRGGYEVALATKSNMSLRLGYDFRYDSSPGDDTKRSDIDYFALLVWTF